MEQKGNAIISSLCWVQRGYAKATLEEYEPSEEEMKKHKKLSKKLLKGGDAKTADLQKAKEQIEQNMDMMDDEGSSDEDDKMPVFTSELARLKEKELGQAGKQDDAELGEDEDLGMEVDDDDEYRSQYSDSSEDKDDFMIRNTDSLLVAATAEEDHSNLEVYIYDHRSSDLYVHHEIILGSFPLCLEWLPVWNGKKTNHVIVGTFLPEIEIWNLDSESVEPTAVLGSLEKSEEYKQGGKAMIKKYKSGDLGTHTEAVMCLSLNPKQQEYLASGSEDSTVRIWDLDDLQCKATFSDIHKDKVQAVKWNSVNDQILLTAGYDSRVNVLDVRDQSSLVTASVPKSAQDIESASWHPTLEHNFAVSTESGLVLGYDSRKLASPVFSLAAHDKAASNVIFSPHIPNMMCTSSTDGTVKVWDIAANGGTNPAQISYRNIKQGELFTLQFCQDIPWVLATAGSQGEMAIWDVSENADVEDHFKPFLTKGTYDIKDYNPDAPRHKSKKAPKDEDFESASDEEEEAPKKKKKTKKQK